MIKIEYIEPTDDDWVTWCTKAKVVANEHLGLLTAGQKPEIDARLYKKMKPVFERLANYLCAYCGSEVKSNQAGDIEHFRPKSGVKDVNFKDVICSYNGVEKKHMGYGWLAYDWRNLLLSCAACNRMSRLPDGRRYGKGERFPVKDDRYAALPEQLDTEEPLLVNPAVDDPAEHIGFDPATGMLFGKTEQGHCTISVLGLNLRELHTARKRVFEASLRLYWAYIKAEVTDPQRLNELAEEVDEIKSGRCRHAIAAQHAISHCRARFEAALARE